MMKDTAMAVSGDGEEIIMYPSTDWWASALKWPHRFKNVAIEREFVASKFAHSQALLLLVSVSIFMMLNIVFVLTEGFEEFSKISYSGPHQVRYGLWMVIWPICEGVRWLHKKWRSDICMLPIPMVCFTFSLLVHRGRLAAFFSQEPSLAWAGMNRFAMESDGITIAIIGSVMAGVFATGAFRCSSMLVLTLFFPAAYAGLTLPLPANTCEGSWTLRFQVLATIAVQGVLGLCGAVRNEMRERKEFLSLRSARLESKTINSMLSTYNDSTISISCTASGDMEVVSYDERFRLIVGPNPCKKMLLNNFLDPAEQSRVFKFISSLRSLPSICATTLVTHEGARLQADVCFVPRGPWEEQLEVSTGDARRDRIAPEEQAAAPSPPATHFLVGIRCMDMLEPASTPDDSSQAVALVAQAQAIASNGLAQEHLDDLESNVSRSVESKPLTTYTGYLFKRLAEDNRALMALGKQEHWMIEADALQIDYGHVLGTGGFGAVLKASYCGCAVAVKQAKQKTVDPQKFAHELRMCRWVRHPNLVQFLGTCFHADKIGLVFELIEGPTLSEFVWYAVCSHKEVVCILMGLSNGLCFLHSQSPPIVHADVKPPNVFVQTIDGQMQIKLGDFGVSLHAKPGVSAIGCSPAYAAPEVRNGKGLSTASDVFSFGRVAQLVILGELPHIWSEAEPLPLAGGGSPFHPGVPAPTPEQDWCRAEVKACLCEDPEKRPSLQSVQSSLQRKVA
eukprot:TRINITY_DN6650_c0_g1_i5.p1 TRINITY_DN6650_c0_g1~~TRINITY_DN6650_c0_g1_i5.p1  ORF type:complete len:734 (+),score=81.16 TRINITY_DN6650_c0_g1_i5:113-2314(+)